MAFAVFTQLVVDSNGGIGAKSRNSRKQPVTETKENDESALGSFGSWLGSVFDVQCCAMRERSELDAQMCCAARPSIKTFPGPDSKHRRPSISSMSDTTQGSDVAHSHRFNPELDCAPLHSSLHAHREVVDKIGSLTDANPYMAREIYERGARSLRLQFLKQCMLRRYTQCDKIWATLNEQDRLDFMQITHMKGKKIECFFLNIMEPDTHTWSEEMSEYSLSEFEMRSDAGTAVSGECHAARSNCSTASTRSSDGSCHGK